MCPGAAFTQLHSLQDERVLGRGGSLLEVQAARSLVPPCSSSAPARFLVHRYSVLRQHAEANGVEGMDALDPGTPASKGGYHDDSDEVSVGVPASPHGDPPLPMGLLGGRTGTYAGDSGG